MRSASFAARHDHERRANGVQITLDESLGERDDPAVQPQRGIAQPSRVNRFHRSRFERQIERVGERGDPPQEGLGVPGSADDRQCDRDFARRDDRDGEAVDHAQQQLAHHAQVLRKKHAGRGALDVLVAHDPPGAQPRFQYRRCDVERYHPVRLTQERQRNQLADRIADDALCDGRDRIEMHHVERAEHRISPPCAAPAHPASASRAALRAGSRAPARRARSSRSRSPAPLRDRSRRPGSSPPVKRRGGMRGSASARVSSCGRFFVSIQPIATRRPAAASPRASVSRRCVLPAPGAPPR